MAAFSSAVLAFIFPHAVLTKILGKPTYATLLRLCKELYANARSVHSTRGGGQNGHLGLIMTVEEYSLRTHGVHFTQATHPGDRPTHVGFATPVEIDGANKTYEALLLEFKTNHQVADSLKAQLLAAIDPTYTKFLEDEMFGYADVSPLEILVHLKTTYGLLKADERGSIRDGLRAPWNPDDPIEDIWTRTNEIVRALARSEPVPESAIIRDQLFVFEQTGVFPRACEAWREKEAVDQTVPSLKTHFTRYNEERMRVLTAKQAGYHASATPSSPAATTNSANAATRPKPCLPTIPTSSRGTTS